jgi:hypothetical protein
VRGAVKRLLSSVSVVRALGVIRGRRVLIAVLLLALVAIFVSRGVIHHVADDAAPATAYIQHEAGEHGAELDVLAIALGLVLVAALVVQSGSALRRPAAARFGQIAIPPPRSRPPVSCQAIPRSPADLQCFLT